LFFFFLGVFTSVFLTKAGPPDRKVSGLAGVGF
jgi:hypothetical protein